MRLCLPQLIAERDRALLVAACEFSDAERVEFRIAVPAELAGALDTSANPFLPMALVLAAVRDEDLSVDGPVSPGLVTGVRQAASVFHGWWGWSVPQLTVVSEEPVFAAGGAVGLLFTRGVDSTSTLVRGLHGELQPAATHLVSIDGLEPAHSFETAARVKAETAAASAEYGLPIVQCATNARVVLDQHVVWPRSFGAVLCGVGLALGPLLHDLVVSSDFGPGYEQPWGNHPTLTPLWSTERTEVHYIGDLTRTEKVRLIAGDSRAMQTLHSCWEADTSRNCGRCVKCLMTMTSLACVGALEACDRFDAPLTARAIRASDPSTVVLWAEVFDEIPSSMPALRDAWRDCLDAEAAMSVDIEPGLADEDTLATIGRVFRATGIPRGAFAGKQFGWRAGEVPLRPPVAQRAEFLAQLGWSPGRLDDRAVAWCLVDRASPETALLASRLRAAWGRGIVYLAGGGDADLVVRVLPGSAVARLLDASRVRAWWSAGPTLDPVALLESVRHGCVPLQIMPDGVAAQLRAELPEPLRASVIGLGELDDHGGPAHARGRLVGDGGGLEGIVRLLTAGSLERDLVTS